MRCFLVRMIGLLLLTSALIAAQSASSLRSGPQSAAAPAGPAPETPPSRPAPKFDVANIDKSVNPCVDFYQFACANWMKNNPIPPDYPAWVSFTEVYEHNLIVLRQVLEKAQSPDPNRSPIDQKIGDYYASCMDEKTINQAGFSPLKPELDRIAALKDKTEMMELIAHEATIGPNPIFAFGSRPDLHDASMTVAQIDQAGITLPDRDYYLKEDSDMVAIRKAFLDHMQKMFTMIGQNSEQAAKSADTVMKIETELAKASMDRTLRRDPKNLDHKMALAEIEGSAPGFHLERYFRATGAPAFKDLNVANPEFFKKINGLIDQTPLDSWKIYLEWQMLNSVAGWLSDPFVQEDFKFNQQFTGQKELPVRWKRCVNSVDTSLGEALGQRYVEQTFGEDGKRRTLKMVEALEGALNHDISDLPWMTPATKKQALIKLEAIRNKIGYPDQWRDYSKVEILHGDMLGDVWRATDFEATRQMLMIGKPVDPKEWEMTPPTVNAYYTGMRNEIVFPAGILQPPFFDRSMDDAVNFGGIGLVIGHELTHGFDDEGRKFDPKGNLRDWWTQADSREFDKRAGCISDEYSGFVSVDDLHLNGKLTLGENTADNGGARLALMALHTMMTETKTDSTGKIDGYTPDQRYFLGFARVWCENITPELSRMAVRVDPHSPGRWRVNGVVRNMPEFQKAFGCKPGQPMVPANACRVW